MSPPVISAGDPGMFARAQCRPPSELTTAIPGSDVNTVSIGPLTATQRVADHDVFPPHEARGRVGAPPVDEPMRYPRFLQAAVQDEAPDGAPALGAGMRPQQDVEFLRLELPEEIEEPELRLAAEVIVNFKTASD